MKYKFPKIDGATKRNVPFKNKIQGGKSSPATKCNVSKFSVQRRTKLIENINLQKPRGLRTGTFSLRTKYKEESSRQQRNATCLRKLEIFSSVELLSFDLLKNINYHQEFQCNALNNTSNGSSLHVPRQIPLNWNAAYHSTLHVGTDSWGNILRTSIKYGVDLTRSGA